ncbi:MAG: hypothetical protein OXU77_05460 [Gammaproteobacteria bacterium]|nr:hypothetical protein [Gammaproteobacteria bacterium]
MNRIMRAVLAGVLVSVGGCATIEEVDKQEITDYFDKLDHNIRQYQTEVLFPALAAASEDQRRRYREIIDSRLLTCGDEPTGRVQLKRWDDCVDEVNAKAADVIGVETLESYVIGKDESGKT